MAKSRRRFGRAAGVIFSILLIFSLSGCESANTIRPDPDHIDDNERFVSIEKGLHYSVFYDKETGVEYFWGSNASVTVLVDKDGKPLIYEGE